MIAHVRPVSRADFEALVRVVNLPTQDPEIQRDAVQGVLTSLLLRSRERRTEEIRELLKKGDRELLRAFSRQARFRFIDQDPGRSELQALRLHVREALASPGELPRAAGFPSVIRKGDRFSGPLVARAIATVLEEIRKENERLVRAGWENDPASRQTVTRDVMSRLQARYLPKTRSKLEPDWVSWRAAKRSAMAPRNAHRLLSEIARQLGSRKASILILWQGGGGYPEIRERLGVGRTSADRALDEVTTVLRRFVMREKGRLRHRGIDVIDAALVAPGDSEWAEVLAEIGKAASARGPSRNPDRNALRRLVNGVLAEAS